MADLAEELPVWLVGDGHPKTRVGLLVRDSAGNVQFVVDPAYIESGPERPILSVSWHAPGDEAKTIARLRDTRDKLARLGLLPPWFGNLLPEGALRTLVESQMPSGRVSEFDIIKHLGGDLPGAVVVGDGNIGMIDLAGGAADIPGEARLPRLTFSLAGVQLKLSSMRQGDRLTLPARGVVGRVIAKLPHAHYPDLPEIEFSSMKLAALAGVDVASAELLPSEAAPEIPERLRPGPSILVVTRFDRMAEGGRVHIEDFNQVMEAVGDQKYARANEESVVNAVHRFAERGAAAAEEALRRIVVNILIGNTDAHLKNWSFIFPDGNRIALAPAYDIVSTVLLSDDTFMALRLRGTKDPMKIDVARFQSFAKYVGLSEEKMGRTVVRTVERAMDLWPAAIVDLPLAKAQAERLKARWAALPLSKARVGHARPGAA